jgi:hypothetical protein
MTRGRPVTTALDVALHIARQRGTVMTFTPGPENFAHFLIRSPGTLTFVLIRYASRLHVTPEEIGSNYHEALVMLRSVPGSAVLVRELWLYSRYGGWRYFRIGDAGVEEVGIENMPLQVTGTATSPIPGDAPVAGEGTAPAGGV